MKLYMKLHKNNKKEKKRTKENEWTGFAQKIQWVKTFTKNSKKQ